MVENNIIFKNKEVSKIDSRVLGVSGENKQQILIFKIEEGFIDGTAYLELILPTNDCCDSKKYSIELKKNVENECYKLEVKRSLLRHEGIVKMQLKIISNGIEVYKTIIFDMNVLEAINAVESIEEDYPCFAEQMKVELQELQEGLEQVCDSLNDTKEETDPTVPAHVKQITEENIESWNNKSDFSGNYEDLENKPKIPDVSKFIDNTVNNLINYDTKKQVDEKIAKIRTMKLERVEVLPTENINTDTIYLVPKSNANNNNIYDQFVFFNDDWEKWGDTEIDLSNYATIEALNEALSNIDLANYATKEEIESLASKLYVDEKIGDIDALLDSIAEESEAI